MNADSGRSDTMLGKKRRQSGAGTTRELTEEEIERFRVLKREDVFGMKDHKGLGGILVVSSRLLNKILHYQNQWLICVFLFSFPLHLTVTQPTHRNRSHAPQEPIKRSHFLLHLF